MPSNWHLVLLLAGLAAAEMCQNETCGLDTDAAMVQLSRRPVPRADRAIPAQMNLSEVVSALRNSPVCSVIQNRSGGKPCQYQPNCTDSAVALCCFDQCLGHRKLTDCADFGPRCQARKTACDMVMFLADGANPLAQPRFHIATNTYPIFQSGGVIPPVCLGGYNSGIWQALQNLTSLCLGDGFALLREESDYIRNHSSGNPCLSQYHDCPTNPGSMKTYHGGQTDISTGIRYATAAAQVIADLAPIVFPGAKWFQLETKLFFPLLGVSLGGTQGTPTNPCTYAGSDWGECVWGQIEKYVKRYVTKYVAGAIENLTREETFERLKYINAHVVALKEAQRVQEMNNGTMMNIIQDMRQLAFSILGKGLYFIDSPLLIQLFSVDLGVQSLLLSAKELRTADVLTNLAVCSTCFAKAVLKRATYLVQSRLSQLKAIQVNRTQLHHNDNGADEHLAYTYMGQYDEGCQVTTPDDDLKVSRFICNPGYGDIHRERNWIPAFRQGYGGCGTTQQDNSWALNWFFHQAQVWDVQLELWGPMLAPLSGWLDIAVAMENQTVGGRKLDWTGVWHCSGRMAGIVAEVANLSSTAAGADESEQVGILAQCPFVIRTTYSHHQSMNNHRTGADTQVAMYQPWYNTTTDGQLYYFGHTCQANFIENLYLTNSMLIQRNPRHWDAIQEPTAMYFEWDNHGSDSDPGDDMGFYTPVCNEGYVPVGSVGEAFLDNDAWGPSNLPPPLMWPGLMCVKENYTERVQLTINRWVWNSHGTGGDFDATVWNGAPYNTNKGVLVSGACYATQGESVDNGPQQGNYVYQLKTSLVYTCTGEPATPSPPL